MKPILFNTDMVRAILDGRKTETRRVIKPVAMGLTYEDGSPARKAPYKPGDILYVRETWTKLYYVDPDGYTHYDQQMYYYAADGTPDIILYDADGFEEDDQRIRWHPSIHMPREIARIFLRVTDVRVERLQDSFSEPISPIFALQEEGMDIGDDCRECISTYGRPCCIDLDEDSADECGLLDDVRGEFSDLWDSTVKSADHDLYGWAANPWVWVIEFERISREEAGGGE